MTTFRIVSDNALEIRNRHEVILIEAWGRDSARVRAAQYEIPGTDIGALVATSSTAELSIAPDGQHATLVNGNLTVRVENDIREANPEPRLSFHRTRDGAELLSESREHFWAPGSRVYSGNRAGSYEIHQQFHAYPAERLYGMGQRTHGRLNLKGLALDLVQRNGEVNIPFVLSSRGYGMLWNQPAIGRVEFAENATRWQSAQARGVDYWITTADSPAAILRNYADVTGHSPALPSWASGFWQSKLRYRTQDELLEVAREFARRDLPLSVIVADYFHWSAMGDYRFDDQEWPDPEAMVAELKAQGVELMVSIWPTVSPLSENFAHYRDHGLLVGTDQGLEVHQMIRDKGMSEPLPVSFYDPTNPETREYVWSLVERNYARHGIRAWWLDASEPELNPADPANIVLHAGPGAQVANVYPRDNARLFAEGMRASSLGETVLFSRSAWAGAQRYGTAVWSGDIPASWESLSTQIRAGLSIGVSGIPWWTTDIGGFHGGDASDPAYRELMVRWFQYGAFCPLFRLHGDREPRTPTGYTQTGGPNEPWSFGEEAYGIIADVIRLRERLRPYVHEVMDEAAASGLPPMRPLFIDFPDIPEAWEIEDQFLFGPEVLVAPITEAGGRSREVYLPPLPAGERWIDAWTGAPQDGGATVHADAPLRRIPIYLRTNRLQPLFAA